jgi:hypothetical protein
MSFKDLGLIEPLLKALADLGQHTPTPIQKQAIPAVLAGGDLLAGAQTGAVLAFVSTGILGQYDPFSGDDGGCLLLVYPNVISVERQLRLVPKDFRLWVCLHEVTHRVQFTANPWLAQYMSRALAVVTSDGGDDVGGGDRARVRHGRLCLFDQGSGASLALELGRTLVPPPLAGKLLLLGPSRHNALRRSSYGLWSKPARALQPVHVILIPKGLIQGALPAPNMPLGASRNRDNQRF